MRRVRALLTLAALLATLPFAAAATAQEVQVEGRVQWVAADRMIVAPFTAPGAVSVDLTQVDQDEYQDLTTGDFVLVTGTISGNGDRLIARFIRRLTS